MPRGRISIGVDDATGQPDNAPRGPYITDDDNGSSPRPKRRMHDHDAGRTKRSVPTAKPASRGTRISRHGARGRHGPDHFSLLSMRSTVSRKAYPRRADRV
jgi:hypothetical protein